MSWLAEAKVGIGNFGNDGDIVTHNIMRAVELGGMTLAGAGLVGIAGSMLVKQVVEFISERDDS